MRDKIIRETPDGVLCVGETRVTLDTIVYALREGETPEEIANQYPSLSLSDVRQAIDYYLRHREEVDKYLEEREKERALEAQNAVQVFGDEERARLQARKQKSANE
jgi:uncharacterized protein (DUF433 family)